MRTCIADHLIQRLHNNLCKVDDYVRIAITAGVDGNTEVSMISSPTSECLLLLLRMMTFIQVSDMLITCATSEALDFPPGALIAMRDASGEVLEVAFSSHIMLRIPTLGQFGTRHLLNRRRHRLWSGITNNMQCNAVASR